MNKEQFVDFFLICFDIGFAKRMSAEIKKQNLQELLVDVMKNAILFHSKNPEIQSEEYDFLRQKKKTEREQISFRSAYLFETLYFQNRNILSLLKNDFAKLLSAITNESMKRHFGKILTDILKNNLIIFSAEEYELMAQTVASWAVAPHTRVAVQIWAFEILVLLREKAKIDEETIGYLLEIFSQDSSPAMKCRLRRWKKRFFKFDANIHLERALTKG